MLKFRHIDTQATLNTVKFSADSTNTTYFLYSLPSSQVQGTPDVNYEDICFVKPTGQVYTHGKLYGNEAVSVVTDSTITENSTNPVQSSAIFTALAGKVNNGGGVATMKKLTQAEYNVLSEKDANTVYAITDGDSLVDQIPIATRLTNGLMSTEDKARIRLLNPGNFNFTSTTLVEACQALISTINSTSKNTDYQLFDGTFGAGNLYMYHGSAYPNSSMLQYSAFLIMNVATGSLYKCGYSAGNWYFNSI